MTRGIVAYYTWSGKTRIMAEIIARKSGAELLEIKPVTPYTEDYNAVVEQAKREISKGYQPAIRPVDVDMSRYEAVYIGTPIWWGTMAPPLVTFLSGQDWQGKIVMPFSTHGGGGKGHSDRDIAKLCAGAKIMKMYTAYEGGGSSAEKDISAWLEKLD